MMRLPKKELQGVGGNPPVSLSSIPRVRLQVKIGKLVALVARVLSPPREVTPAPAARPR